MKTKQDYFAAVNSEPLVQIKGMTTGQEFSFWQAVMTGVLKDIPTTSRLC